tara:strand:- start:216 stop:416 length:201 start_codon:yes stop_codon:yes gene_type:complete
MNLPNKIILITFAVFMVEAILHYNLGKEDCSQRKENEGILPPVNSLLKLALIVGLFSVVNSKLINA